MYRDQYISSNKLPTFSQDEILTSFIVSKLQKFEKFQPWRGLVGLKYNCCGTCGPINACLISNDVSHLAKALDALENFLQRKKRQIQPQAKHCQRYKVIDLLDLRKHEQAFFMASRQIIEEQHSIIMCGAYRQHSLKKAQVSTNHNG